MPARGSGKGYEARPNGTYRVTVRVNGNKVHENVATEEEAILRVASLRATIPGAFSFGSMPEAIKATRKRTPTVADLLDQLIDKPGRAQATRDKYEGVSRAVDKAGLGVLEVGLVTPSQVLAFFRDEANFDARVAVLSLTFNAAIKRGYRKDNPLTMADIHRPRRTQKEIEPLLVPQLRALVAAAKIERDALAFRLGGQCGLRGGEIGGMRVEDLTRGADGRCYIKIRQASKRTSAGLEVGKPKTPKSGRNIAVPCDLMDAILKFVDGHPSRSGAIFETSQGNVATTQTFNHAIHGAAKRTGLRVKRFHDLRHTCASQLLARGADIRQLMEYLGHATVRETIETYSHLFAGSGDALALGMETAWTEAGS